MTPETPVVLSAAGEARRDRMLRSLGGVMRRRRLARVASRSAGLAAPLVAVVVVAYVAVPHRRPPAPAPSAAGHVVDAGRMLLFTRVVETDASITRRITAEPAALTVRMISDDQLQDLLAQTSTPTGYVRTRGKVLLASDITPAEPAGKRPNSRS